MIFGGATRYLLDHVTLPMLMAHFSEEIAGKGSQHMAPHSQIAFQLVPFFAPMMCCH